MLYVNDTPIPYGLINFTSIVESIKENYDISKYNDPNSDELSSSNLAFAEGWINGLVQIFASEFFCKSIHSTSVFPKELYDDEEIIVEYIFNEMDFWFNLAQNMIFKYKFMDMITSVIKSKSEWEPDDTGNGASQASGMLYDMNLGKKIRIDGWEDATKMLIRRYYPDSLSFIKSRVSKLNLVGNPNPQDINPLEILTYPQVLDLADPPYGLLVSNSDAVSTFEDVALDYSDDSAGIFLKQGLNKYEPTMQQSLFQASRIDQFYNGKFFFQSYFKLKELIKGGTKYVTTKSKLVNQVGFSEQEAEDFLSIFAKRPVAFRGHVSSQNLKFIVEEMTNGDVFASLSKMGAGSALYEAFEELGYVEESAVAPNILSSDITDKLPAFKYSMRLEDMFEEVNHGVRLCYGFVSSDKKLGTSNIPLIPNAYYPQSHETFQSQMTREVADKIDEMLNPLGSTAVDDADTNYEDLGSIIPTALLTKSLRIVENFGTGAGSAQEELKSYIFPMISSERKIVGDADMKYAKTTIQKMKNYFGGSGSGGANFEQLSDPENVFYYTYKLFIDDLQFDGEYVEELNTMVSEILSSSAYSSIFKFGVPISKIMTMLSVYNTQEVSFHIPANINFIGTKAVLKDLLETIYNTKGPESYKNEAPSSKESGGPTGMALSSQKATTYKGL